MNTYTVTITGTDYSPYGNLEVMDVLDGGILIDPLAAPLSFYYALTTNCGSLTGTNSVFTLTAMGSDFETKYNDLKKYEFTKNGDLVFCKTLVNFNFSFFDQTRSLIKSVVFYPDNSEKVQIENIRINSSLIFPALTSYLIYPALTSLKSTYYPNEKFYTIYKPKFIINYDDGTSQTIVSPLTVAQCGIFESYRDKVLLESLPYLKEINNVAIFLNDKKSNDLLANILDVKSPFISDTSELDTVELPFSVSPIPLGTVNPFVPIAQEALTPSIPVVPSEENPIQQERAIYRYFGSNGIVLGSNPSDLNEDEDFIINESITITVGKKPYVAGFGITITTTEPLNN
jgi:hypothetical protein